MTRVWCNRSKDGSSGKAQTAIKKLSLGTTVLPLLGLFPRAAIFLETARRNKTNGRSNEKETEQEIQRLNVVPIPSCPPHAADYKYDVRVKACDETNSSSVMGYFCSHSSCNGTVGEEVQVPLQMNDEVGGWTLTQFNSTFNPVAMRLEKVDESW